MRSTPVLTQRRRLAAFTLVDVMGATVVVGLLLGALFIGNGRSIQLLKSAKQAAVASKCLQQRIEQIRNYNWTQVTDAQAMQDLYAVPPLPSVELPGFAEQVTVSAYTPPIPPASDTGLTTPYLRIARSAAGAVSLVQDNPSLTTTVPQVRVDVQITWPGPNGTTRMRETSVIIANGGIGR